MGANSRWSAIFAGCMLLVFGTPAEAQKLSKDNDICVGKIPGDIVAACTRLMESGKSRGVYRGVALEHRGLQRLKTSEFAAAARDYSEAIKIKPSPARFNNRGVSFWRLREYDIAIADFNEALRLDPKNPHTFRLRGTVYVYKKDPTRALQDLNEALRLQPDNTFSLAHRGTAYLLAGDLERARRDFATVARLQPNDADALNSIAWGYVLGGYGQDGIAQIERALVMQPDNPHYLDTRAHVREAMGDLSGALTDFRRAFSLKPSIKLAEEGLERVAAKIAAAPAPQRAEPAAAPDNRAAAATASATPERRVALVIGNSAYKNASALPNPRRDAETLASTLRAIGFQTVTLENDLSRDRLMEVLRAFSKQAEQADWAMVYYAGHGIEMNGANYLLPVDATIDSDRDIQFAGVALEHALAAVDSAKKLRMVVLDACRDNPFARTMRRTSASRSVGRGLARVEPDGATLVAYAAKHGEVAMDGDGGNSPFLAALVKHLPTPGLEINKLFRLVRDEVLTATQRKQEPFLYGSLPAEDLFFVAAK